MIFVDNPLSGAAVGITAGCLGRYDRERGALALQGSSRCGIRASGSHICGSVVDQRMDVEARKLLSSVQEVELYDE